MDVGRVLEEKREEMLQEAEAKNRAKDLQTRNAILTNLARATEPCVTISIMRYQCFPPGRDEASYRRTCDFLSQQDERFSCSWSEPDSDNELTLKYCYKK